MKAIYEQMRQPRARRPRFMRSTSVATAVALWLAVSTPMASAEGPSVQGGAATPATPPSSSLPGPDQQRAAVISYLRHIYSIYFGMRSCTEMSAQQQDHSFLPVISLDEARKRLRLIDIAVGEIGIDANRVWTLAAPLAEVTAEALKRDPAKHLPFCQRMASLFRMDADNLQVILRALGAKTILVPKDY
ncbi:MAG: hypothetical protein OTI36_13360 [Beijerinckiaceae bacterium]|jgi:hypothetical protein|nr:hypothetical protein [Beijerinckiaceae bacterium]